MDRSLFSGETVRDPVLMALDYLDVCKRLADVATLQTMRAHVRYIIEFQWYVPRSRGLQRAGRLG